MERFGEEHVITSQYTWVLDRLRRRFRRVPIGNDPGDPTVPVPWLPYTGLWRDDRTGALTLALDAAGTRLLRVGPSIGRTPVRGRHTRPVRCSGDDRRARRARAVRGHRE
jgi:hypothetical protein